VTTQQARRGASDHDHGEPTRPYDDDAGRAERADAGVAGADGAVGVVGVVRSLDRALTILDELALAPAGLGLVELSRRSRIAKSTAHRLISTLERRGYVARLPGGRYALGLTVFGAVNLPVAPVLRTALEGLAQHSGESVNFGVLHGTDVVYVDRVESRHALRWGLTIGSCVPMHCSGMGKAILGALPPGTRRDALRSATLRPLTRNTITDMAMLEEELQRVHAAGYAIDDGEYMDGVLCIAAAVRRGASVIGAVSIAGPALRFTREVALAQRPALFDTVRVAAGLLGMPPPDRGDGAESSTADHYSPTAWR